MKYEKHSTLHKSLLDFEVKIRLLLEKLEERVDMAKTTQSKAFKELNSQPKRLPNCGRKPRGEKMA